MSSGIETKSPITAWYLTRIRGLKVAYRSLQPKYVAMGFVVYATTWVIVPS
ncbi:MAG: hypothetical protein AMXMBFR82_17160 [Candidatus Hydrogenedentota bacterium]